MRWMKAARIGLALALATVAPAVLADALYVATARGYVAVGNAIGRLYEVDPATGRTRIIGDLRVDKTPVGVSGLARHPASGVLYGITSSAIPAYPSQLVTIDTDSGAAKLVGPLGTSASDINFDARGRLFAWMPEWHRLAEIDVATGKAAPIEVPGLAGDVGGLAIDRDGVAVLAVSSGAGKLTRVDLARRVVVGEVALADAPFKQVVNSLTFSPEGKLVGVNSDGAMPPRTALVAIDVASGRVSSMTDLPQDADGITFIRDAPGAVAREGKSYVSTIATAGGLVVLVAVISRLRRRKPD